MAPRELSEHLGRPLTQLAADRHPAYCVRYDYAGQYALDESGAIIALNLRGMALADDPGPWLAELPRLRYLNLSECGLTTLTLPELPELIVLNLSRNAELRTLQLPEAFPALLRAELSHCQLAAVRWPTSPVLEFLNASRQEEGGLEFWSFATACARLYYLDLSHNQLVKFALGEGFENLGMLCLESNRLRTFLLADKLPGLESLRLQNNELESESIPLDLFDLVPNLLNLYLSGNQLTSDFTGGLENKSPAGAVGVASEVLHARRYGVEYDRECKVLIVGNGKAGKSNLMKRLLEEPFEKDWDSTHGVIIRRHEFPEFNYVVRFWDFGGQDIYHATHRLFLQSDSVYLVVWNPEVEAKPFEEVKTEKGTVRYENFTLPYWLDYVHRSSSRHRERYSYETERDGAPVLVVQTRKAGKEGIVDKTGLDIRFRTRFKSYRSGLAVESDENEVPKLIERGDDDGYADLKKALRKALYAAHPPQRLPKSWLELRKRVRARARQSDVVTLDQYETELVGELRDQLGRTPREVLTDWLFKTGVVYYREGYFGDQIILNQTWATEAVYTIFKREKDGGHYHLIKGQEGRISGADLRVFWRTGGFADRDHEVLVDFMLSCGICFETEPENKSRTRDGAIPLEERQFFAPQLMRENIPPPVAKRLRNIDDDSDQAARWWHLRYYHEFLHKGIVRRFIVRMHERAELEHIWADGIMLTDDENYSAIVHADRDRKSIFVKVDKRSSKLLAEVYRLLEELQSYDRPDSVWVSADDNEEVELDTLLRHPEINPIILSRAGIELDFAAYRPFRTVIRELERAEKEKRFPGEAPVDQELPESPPETAEPRRPDRVGPANDPYGRKKLLIQWAVSSKSEALSKLNTEVDAIFNVKKKQGNHFGVITQCDQITQKAFYAAIANERPHYLHFIGHGNDGRLPAADGTAVNITRQSGIVILSDDGTHEVLKGPQLAKLLKTLIERGKCPIELVVLNACHTIDIAEGLCGTLGIPTIGNDGILADPAGADFGTLFYGQLQANGNIGTAFDIADGYVRSNYKNCNYRLFEPARFPITAK